MPIEQGEEPWPGDDLPGHGCAAGMAGGLGDQGPVIIDIDIDEAEFAEAEQAACAALLPRTLGPGELALRRLSEDGII